MRFCHTRSIQGNSRRSTWRRLASCPSSRRLLAQIAASPHASCKLPSPLSTRRLSHAGNKKFPNKLVSCCRSQGRFLQRQEQPLLLPLVHVFQASATFRPPWRGIAAAQTGWGCRIGAERLPTQASSPFSLVSSEVAVGDSPDPRCSLVGFSAFRYPG